MTKTNCPNCLKSFDVPSSYEGKRATCANCKGKFVVVFPKETPPEIPMLPPKATVISSPFEAAPTKPKTTKSPGLISRPVQMWVAIASASVALLAGYFVGREHLKYEMRNKLAEVFSGFPGARRAAAEAANVKIEKPAPPKPTEPPLAIGTNISQPGFSLALTAARIGKVKMKSLRDTYDSTEEYLVLSFTIANKDDRKVLNFSDNRFSGGNFALVDDVENTIRGIDFGFSSKVVDDVGDSEDIPPSSTINIVKVFAMPLPKTQSMTLTINLECLDGKGEVRFAIPMATVTRG